MLFGVAEVRPPPEVINKMLKPLVLATVAAAAAVSTVTAATGPEKPNVIFMLVDDLGHNDMEWNDQFNQISSPKINALRQTGITLDQYVFFSQFWFVFLIGTVTAHAKYSVDILCALSCPLY